MRNKKIILFASITIAWIAISLVFDFIIKDNVMLLRCDVLDIIFNWITHFGSVFVVLILMTSLFMWREKKREWVPTIWVSYITSIILVFILKQVFSRGRPGFTDYYPFINVINYSFPSMHAAAAFAAIPILDKEFPKLKWFWVAFAIMVGFSRIYFNIHFLSDVVAGAFLGYAVGWTFVKIEEKKEIFKKILKVVKL